MNYYYLPKKKRCLFKATCHYVINPDTGITPRIFSRVTNIVYGSFTFNITWEQFEAVLYAFSLKISSRYGNDFLRKLYQMGVFHSTV